eukprot:gene39629-48971_t
MKISDFCIRSRAKIDLWMAVFREDSVQSTGTNVFVLLHKNFTKLRRTISGLTLFIVLLFLPTFAALSSLYPTLTVQYAWFVSAAYLKGRTPAMVIAVLGVVFTCVLLYLMPVAPWKNGVETSSDSVERLDSHHAKMNKARRHYLPHDSTEGQSSLLDSQRKREEAADMPFLSSIILFNSILAPCLANAA